MAIAGGAETRVNTYTSGDQSLQEFVMLPGGGWVATWVSDGQDGSGEGVYQQAYDATGAKVGNETHVSTFTTGYQHRQKVAVLEEGGWIVVWESGGMNGQDGSGTGIYQQRFNEDGDPLGIETPVNTYTVGSQDLPQVAALSDGGWVVVWVSFGQDGPGYDIYQQRYNKEGATVGGETRVNVADTGMEPIVTALPGGGWLVVWQSTDGQDTSGEGVYLRRYDASGNAATADDVQVNTFTTGSQSQPKVTVLKNGGWVVTWVSANQDGSGEGVYQQAYSASGATVGSETRVNTYTTLDQNNPKVDALADGGWVVTWQSSFQDGANGGIYQQAFNADGSARGGETHVNVYTAGNQWSQQVAALSGGGWVVTWQSDAQDGSGAGIYQRAYNANGTAMGSEMLVNTTTTNHQWAPTVIALGGDRWVVAWKSWGQDGSGWGVYQKLFQLTGDPPTDIKLSGSHRVAEGAAKGTVVGSLTATDPDAAPGDAAPTFALVTPDGRFAVSGTKLVVANGSLIDFETATSHTVKVRVTDADGGTFQKSFVISVIDLREGKTTAGNDTISGTGAAERLNGGLGNDVLTGKGGADTFVFDTKLNKKSNVDRITDFEVGIDRIELDKSIFKKLKLGELKAKAFTNGKVQKDDRIIYNKKSGDLAYDADGKGGSKAVKFATLDGSPDDLSARDFIVVA